ncbi:hypothetical protein [Marinobacter zhejiangensis]|uniref:SMI1 / KNR4 family (SUKH-1) n=1 Tax=Marinobacter zhejiangensis TaxID=488535 RepID=A0A1I4NDG8_9GAMM|nr:hypothetical protein [Marinobacter zhejiangensis]SFM13426.1 hypothetical protein SAMN04487963_1308 [Marinobacter zhejiangensis]
MDLNHITYKGPDIDDEEVLASLPDNLANLLSQINGFIQYHGGLHIYGACRAPQWHSIREAWHGEAAAHKHYESIRASDVPLGEDCLGFQFFLRDKQVIFLDGETGDVEELGLSLREFFAWVADDPVDSLGMQPLHQFMEEGNICEPGKLLAEYPFFCTKESEQGVSLSAVPCLERRQFLADLHNQLSGVQDGGKFDVTLV